MKLTKPLLEAIATALDAALSGDGFDGGDFDGLNRDHFERAQAWVAEQQNKRAGRAALATTKGEKESEK